MNRLRRYTAFVATLVLVIVVAQSLDMGLCCEVHESDLPEAPTDVLLLSERGTSTDYLAPGHDDGPHQRSEEHPECLCHLVFVSTSAGPSLQAAIIPISVVPEVQTSPPTPFLSPPGHVPLV
ncbi:MAG: hypothetical protein GVY18_08600 [Bacteroidetes bacterium]|jgi:hypothetical protein|nr:hypothetical protein [Bacteroidota bacterium]